VNIERVNIENSFEEMIEAAKQTREGVEQFTPVLITIDMAMRIAVTAMIFHNQTEHDLVMDNLNAELRSRYQKGHLFATITIMDTWVRVMDAAAAAVYLGAGKRPRDDPQRHEAIVAVLRTPGTFKAVEVRYHREQGRVVWDERVESDEGHSEGSIRDWSQPCTCTP
jgi:hypothetical protein